MDKNSFECHECGHENDVPTSRSTSGKRKVDCEECGENITWVFYCSECDVVHGGRVSLKKYDNGSVAEYVCPDCDGILFKGEVLDVKQGMHR